MKEPTRILFLSQEIYPYLSEETDVRLLNRKMPEFCQANGCETRTFMPKFGEINERRNQLHEVIRLSGMNLIIEDTDHPLLLKVASIQSARIQIYFIDNDDFFKRRRGVMDENGVEYSDNDERTIFFTRGVLETVKKLRWTPDLIVCSGWMAAIAPFYIKHAYKDTPFFQNAKVIYGVYDQTMNRAFPENFWKKMLTDGLQKEDVKSLVDRRVTYTTLMHLAIDNSDGVIQMGDKMPKAMLDYITKANKKFMPYQSTEPKDYYDFYREVLNDNKALQEDEEQKEQ